MLGLYLFFAQRLCSCSAALLLLLPKSGTKKPFCTCNSLSSYRRPAELGVAQIASFHHLSKFSATSIILQRESNSPSKSGCISLTDQILVSFLSLPSMKLQLNFFLRDLDRVILQQLTHHITYIAINNTYTPAVKMPSTSHWIN